MDKAIKYHEEKLKELLDSLEPMELKQTRTGYVTHVGT